MSLRAGSEMMMYSLSRDALRYVEDAYDVYHQVLGPDHVETALAALTMGDFEFRNRRYSSADDYLREALRLIGGKIELARHEVRARSLLLEVYERQGRRSLADEQAVALGHMIEWPNMQEYEPIFKSAPVYPSNAIRAGREAYVIVEYTVDGIGRVKDPVVVESDGDVPGVQTRISFEIAR